MTRLAGLLVVAACSGDPDPEPIHIGNPGGGNPLNPAEALYPWPSDFALRPSSETETGRELWVEPALLPEGVPVETFAGHDGFTRAPAILTLLPGGVEPADLPDLAGSMAADSPVLLLAGPDWKPVPLLVELDQTMVDPLRQPLILRPQVVLDEQTAHVVVLRTGLRDRAGALHEPSPAYVALRDGTPTDSPELESLRPGFDLVEEALAAAGVAPDDAVLAWSFHTRSEAQVVTPTLHMHDVMATAPLGAWTPISDTVDGDLREVLGTFEVPDFIGTEQLLELDAAGLPVQKGTRTVEVLVTIPTTVTEPRPVVAFGHGFFSLKEEPTWGSLQQVTVPWAFPTISADFLGFNEHAFGDTALVIGGDLDGGYQITAQQLQSQAQFTALQRLVTEQLADAITEDRGAGVFHPLDGSRVHYMGISNGGSQGLPIVAASPVLDRGVLVVPGGAWTHMLQRAWQWTSMGVLLTIRYTDPVDMQLVVSMMQQVLDPVDGLNFAGGLGAEPYAGRNPKQLSLHEAVGDAEVANMVTEWVARSADVPLLVPSSRDVWGLTEVDAHDPQTAGLPSALYIYDEGYPPLPEGNVPPEENGAHETIRDLDAYIEHVGRFLEDGVHTWACDGPCDPE